MAGYPLVVDLAGRRVVVVGAGRVGLRKIHDLLEAGADTLVAVSPSTAAALPARVTHLARKFTPEDVAGAWLVIAATDDPHVNTEVLRECNQHNIWCIASGALHADVTHSPARTPAHRRAGELLIAVSAGGTPGLATHLADEAWTSIRNRAPFVAAVSGIRQYLKQQTEDSEQRRLVMTYLASSQAAADFDHGGPQALSAVVGGILSGEIPPRSTPPAPTVSVTLHTQTPQPVGDPT
jgi:siroheme synthase-like protein